jgi:hypothetical protein
MLLDHGREQAMESLEAFIHYQNLILFKRHLADPRMSDARRQMLLRLLAEEEAKDPSGVKDLDDRGLRIGGGP